MHYNDSMQNDMICIDFNNYIYNEKMMNLMYRFQHVRQCKLYNAIIYQ